MTETRHIQSEKYDALGFGDMQFGNTLVFRRNIYSFHHEDGRLAKQ
jgi:hypothetical protein